MKTPVSQNLRLGCRQFNKYLVDIKQEHTWLWYTTVSKKGVTFHR